MKLPDFREADLAARRAIDAGMPVPSPAAAALGLRFWWTMPRCLRASSVGAQRNPALRRWVAECRVARAGAGGAR